MNDARFIRTFPKPGNTAEKWGDTGKGGKNEKASTASAIVESMYALGGTESSEKIPRA